MDRYNYCFVVILMLFGCGGAGGGSAPVSAIPVVAFIGDSITSQWDTGSCIPGSFNAGVSGNFTWQMAARFKTDVIDKHPAVVVILGGTNDVAGGAFFPVGTDAIYSMAAGAKAVGIVPIIATIPPNSSVPTTFVSGPQIVPEWNAELKTLASTYGFKIVDYYPLFLSPDGSQNMTLYDNPTHPNKAGEALMCAEVKKVIG